MKYNRKGVGKRQGKLSDPKLRRQGRRVECKHPRLPSSLRQVYRGASSLKLGIKGVLRL
jgi:hypothetical protein